MMRARETFWAPGDRRVLEGQLIRDDDPVLKGREHLFDPMTVTTPAENSAVMQELLDRLAALEGGAKAAPAKKAAASK